MLAKVTLYGRRSLNLVTCFGYPAHSEDTPEKYRFWTLVGSPVDRYRGHYEVTFVAPEANVFLKKGTKIRLIDNLKTLKVVAEVEIL